VPCVSGDIAACPARCKRRLISCRDAVGRKRSVIVEADRCGVVVVAPAGEAAVLSDDEVTALCSALLAARAERK